MKRIFSNVMLLAAAATAFFSCQKPEVIVPETSQEVTLTFSSEKPAFDDETKTEWTGETIQWSAGDKISVAYTVDGNWQSNTGDADGNAKIYQSNPIDEATSVAHFNVPTSFTGTTEGTHIFYAVYPALGNNNLPNAPVANISISPNQNPKADSFDSSADVMIGETGEYNARPDANETISLMWNRLVAHAVLTLNNINGFTEGEVIDNITLTAQSGANLVGLQDVNLITREYEKNEGNTSSNVLKVLAKNLIVNNGTVTFWACVLPETLTSLTVEVETNKATYTREISEISKTFKQNARNILSIKMNEAVREEKVVDNNEVVDVLNRALTGVSGTNYTSWSGMKSVSDAVYAGQSAGGNESIQLRSNNSNSGIVTTTSGGFAKKVVVTWNSNTSNGRTLDVYGSNTAYTNPTELYNTNQGTKLGSIVCGTSTELVIDGEYEFIGLRSNSGAMYVEEIKITWSTAGVEPDTTPKLVVAEESLSLTAAAAEGTIAVTAKNVSDISVTALDEKGSQDEVDWLTVEYANGDITYTAAANESEDERTAYIEVYALDLESNELVAGVNVTQAGKVVVDPNFEAGDYWIIGVEDGTSHVMLPLASNETYGYPSSEVIADNRTFAKYAFTFEAVEGGFNIKASDDRYYSTKENYKSFQITEDTPSVWTVSAQNDGTYLITDASTGKTIKYGDGTYTTFGVYGESDDNTGVYPILVKADNPLSVELSSISVSGQKTSFTVGDAFEFDGTVTATYNDGSTKNVTPTSISSPDMEKAENQVITVTYTEGTITKTTSYTIYVTDPNAGGGGLVPSNSPCYTLDTSSNTGGSNGYATDSEITVDEITWVATGNTTMAPWRIGGKSLTNVDRNVYTKTAYTSPLSKVEFVAGSVGVTWNSLKLMYSTNADFSNAQTITATGIGANNTISFEPEEGFPSNCYYKFVINITVSGSSNKYMQLNKIVFYGYE